MRLLPLIKFDWLATDETAGLYVEAERESKGVLSGSERKRSRLWLGRSTSLPHTRVFFAKSSELLEKKRVEFLTSAKECGIF